MGKDHKKSRREEKDHGSRDRREDVEEREKEKNRDKERERDKSRDMDRERDKIHKDRVKDKDYGREREMEKEHHERGRERKEKERDRDREKERDRTKERDREKHKDREKEKEKEKDKDRDKTEREKGKDRDKDKEATDRDNKERSRDRDRDKLRGRSRDEGHERVKDSRKVEKGIQDEGDDSITELKKKTEGASDGPHASTSHIKERILESDRMMPEIDISTLDTAPDIGNCWEICDIGGGGGGINDNFIDASAELFNYSHDVDETAAKVDELEQKLTEVSQFYSSLSKKQPNNSKVNSVGKDKDKEKQIVSINKHQQDAAKREAASAKRMQELMRQFATILRQITQHKWAWPFMQPVDVQTLGLHDYYEVIDKPMDFSTIKNQMEAKDGTGYKNVREIYADVRLVFNNATTYNEKGSDVHVMAKTLLAKFEEKWLQLLPKVVDEEDKRKEEEAEAHMDMQLVKEVANAKLARDISKKLSEVDKHLEKLRDMVVLKCRKMSVEEKKKLGSGLGRLSPEDLGKALEIIAQNNPSLQSTDKEMDIDLDAQSESTLWRLKIIVKEALLVKGKNTATKGGNDTNSKRKREICEAIAKTAKKRSKKLSSHVDPCP